MAHSGKTMTFATDLMPQEDDIYSLGDNDLRWRIYGNIQPIASKSYQAYTCSSNDANKAVLFFGKINITDYDPWQTPWSIHYRMYITTSNANMQGWYDCLFSVQGSTVTYYNYNNFYSTSYRPIYHHRLLYPKSGYSNYGGYFGVRVQSANEVTTTARIFKIEILETKNCTIELFSTIKRFDEIYITTNGIAASTIWNNTDYNGTDNGLKESGDDNSNTYDRTYINNKKKARVAIAAQSICVGNSSGYAGIDNGVTFDIAYPILYQPTAIAANAEQSDFYIYYPTITSTNHTAGLTHIANSILYMTGTLSGTTFTCNSKTLTYITPTSENGIIYIPVGINTNNTTQSFYFLGGIARMFWYKNGAFRECSGASQYALAAPLSGISGADDLKAIEALSGTSGLLKKTAANTWTLDTSNYVTSSGVTKISTGAGLTGGDITTTGTISINGMNTSSGSTSKWLNQKGEWTTPPDNTYTLPAATSGALGGIKIGFSTNATNRNYAVQLSSEKAYVNVPWTDTNNKVTQAYSTADKLYPLLISATEGITSTNTRGDTTAILNNALYANPSKGSLYATTLHVDKQVTLQYNDTDQSLEFIF